MGCPMMGSEGPAVQADSTWYSERRVVRPTAIVADLTVPVVRAAVVRQAALVQTACFSQICWHAELGENRQWAS